MTSTFPTPPQPGISPNVASTITLTLGYTVAAGQKFYATATGVMFNGGYSLPYGSLTNNGSLWVKTPAGDTPQNASVLNLYYVGAVTNNGLALAQSANGSAQTFFIGASLASFTNTGQIYAIAPTAAAIAEIDWSGSGSTVTNSGLIAAQGLGATGVYRYNGGAVVNTTLGSILAEGGTATGVLLGRGHLDPPGVVLGPDLNNAGVIRAVSTNPSNPSVGVYLSSLDHETMLVVNSGTISGDFAIFVDDYAFSPPTRSTQTIQNAAGGVINGEIYLADGADVLVNAGQINGYVDMGDGADTVDNTAGTINGTVDLEFGDDLFQGGGAAEAVIGGRGGDTIYGGGGADLLFGGRGDDFLIGGTGNDGLYGEYGADRITTAGGDHVDAGAGDDTVVLGDYQFADVDGGDGRDTLVLPAAAKVLDLAAALASGRIHNFEAIDLPGAQELVIRPGDVAALGAGTSLSVTTTAAGKVDLVGAWAAQAPVTVGGVSYIPYLLNGVTVLVAGAGQVAVLGSAPGGASGLDAVAAGAAAPLPGSTPGAVLASSVTETTLFDLTSTLIIDSDEHWLTNGSIALITSNEPRADLINHGQLTATGGVGGARALAGMTWGAVTNTGVISAAATGDPASLSFNIDHLNIYGVERAAATLNDATYGLYQGGNSSPLLNTGQISASSVSSSAVAYNNWSMAARNEGQISGVSTDFVAFGVYAHNGGTLTNTGDITADGKIGAYAVGASTWSLNLVNSGNIIATVHAAGKESVAIDLYYQMGTSVIANSGVITGDIAIRTFMMVNGGGLHLDNSGQINGRIELNLGVNGLVGRQDVLLNHGSISGDVNLGLERDIYVGTGGTQAGVISGQEGDDILVGGAVSDRLNGGAGDDAIRGAGGADTLTGGAGKDVFLYGAVSDSTAAASDTLTDFETGVDHIDLSALAVTGPVALDFAGGVTTLTATAAGGGQLVIHVTGAVAQGDLILTSQAGLSGGADADLLVAGAFGSTLTGLAGDDLLVGSAAADRLDGGDGADLMAGGAGDDVYVVDEQDTVTELPGGGVDTIEGRVSFGGAEYVIPDNVENLVMITGITAVGNALDNIITGNGQANFLRATGGIDTLIGGAGNDTYYVDAAGDIIVENPGEGTELVSATASYTLGANLENLTLESGGGAISGTGNALANVITGNDFANTLNGAGGDDTLYAGRGADRLYGGDGADLAFGDLDADTLWGEAGNDTLYGDVGADSLYGGAGNDTLKGASALYFDMIGGTWRLTMADDNAADTLYGGAGDDLLDGAGGGDSLYGGAGHDTAVYGVKLSEAQWTHNGDGSWTVTAGADGTDTLWGVEILQFTDGFVTIGHNSEVPADFNADGKSDVLWRNDSGEIYVWNSQAGQGAFVGQSLGNPGLAWHVQAVGDYDADGKADVLWRNDAGDLYVYRSDDGGAVSFTGQSISYVDPVWQVVPAAGDFNGDGRADILYRNSNTGEVYLWNSNTGADVSFAGQSLGAVGQSWHIQAVDDFTGDGKADVLWRSDAGDVYLWLTFAPAGAVSMNGQSVSSVGADWSILGTGDFNGDGRADVLWRHAGDGELYVWNSQSGNDVNFLGQSLGTVSLDWSVAAIGDYDGDGRADVLFRNADGRVYLWNSTDTGPVAFAGQGLGTTPTDWHILSDFHGM
jgi:Ca2+-binding RTX toxin-like protein